MEERVEKLEKQIAIIKKMLVQNRKFMKSTLDTLSFIRLFLGSKFDDFDQRVEGKG